ncbi:MAG: RNA polymerase sigma factor [Bacteroidota bacterium]
MKEEEIWVKTAKEGDERAFHQLYNIHVEPLYRFMHRYSQDTFQVEDWVQRAFIKAFKNISTYNATARFSTWLFTIALNEMRTDFRRPNLVVLDSATSENGNIQQADENFIWDDIMKTWLDDLDESKRTVFILYEVEGYSHAEIASMLNIGESSSRTLLHRAKHYLKSRWQAEEKSA